MNSCEKCNGAGVILPGKFKVWWLSFFYGYDKDYIEFKYQEKCDCRKTVPPADLNYGN
jgi:hypothetical protein